MNPAPLRIGISACLLGEKVRYDGGHKRDALIMEHLGPYMTFIPVCPEVELGMGVPREPVRLERSGRGVRMVGATTGTDHTAAMTRFAERRAAGLEALDLSGYVFKKNSPSCGPGGVPIHGRGRATRSGRGLFAAALRDRMPLLPVVDESELADRSGQERFLERVRAYRRLRDFFSGRWTVEGLVQFHALERSRLRKRRGDLDRLVARAHSLPRATLAARYEGAFMGALGQPRL